MKVPTWVKIVAILMIFKGGCGIMQNVGNISSPKILEIQEEFIDEISDEIEEGIEEERAEEAEERAQSEASDSESDENGANSENEEDIEEEESDDEDDEWDNDNDLEELESVKKMLTVSDYYKKWIVRFGYVGIVVSFISIVAGIFLFTPKRFSLPLAYTAIGLSIVAAIATYIVMSNDDNSGMITMFSGVGNIMVAVFNVILLLIIVANDKSVFYPMEDEY